MTMSLIWAPVIEYGGSLPDGLKYILRSKYGQSCVDVTLGSRSIEYLMGLADAGVIGAYDLVQAIDSHGQVRVYEK